MKYSLSDQYSGENVFGRSCAALRKRMNLTQRELGKLLEISEQAIQYWERGVYLPRLEHLERLIELCIQYGAFTPGREYKEAEQIWQAAQQKADFDSSWPQMQHGGQSASPAPALSSTEVIQSLVVPIASSTLSRFDWGEALDVRNFYGREQELALLTRWIGQDRQRVVGVLGMGGIGKSALAVMLMYQLASSFQTVIFRSVRDAPPCRDLLIDYLQVLAPQSRLALTSNVAQLTDLLLASLRAHRCLLVLDNLETLLQEQDQGGHYRPDYEDYGILIRRIAEAEHQSCLLLTSREKPADLELLESNQAAVHTLQLMGLEKSASERLLAEREVVGTTKEQSRLIEMYMGNPLALYIVAETIIELFDGQISPFLEQGEVIFSGIRDLLAEQFARLSEIEQSLLIWLAIVREPLNLEELIAICIPPIPHKQAREAAEALQRRSLIERGKQQTTFTLQSVVMEFVTEKLVEQICDQVQCAAMEYLTRYALEMPGKEYVRQTQERMLVAPIIEHLLAVYQYTAAVEEQLLQMLNRLHNWEQEAQGYGPANLITLLRKLHGHLRHIDLSRLVVRSAYLQGVEMQDASLVGATLRGTSFTEAFDPAWSVAISSNGEYWAAGSARGEVRVWRKGGQILHLVWQAHTDNTYALSFSPDGSTLASASWDGTVKLWKLEGGTLLWTGWHTNTIQSLAFAPDGGILASCGNDEAVRLWDPKNGMNLRTLPHPGYVFAVAWSPDGHLLASSCFDGRIRLWEMQKTVPTICVEILSGHTDWVKGLAFAPDGSMLASASWDCTVRLWEIPSGRLIQILTGHKERVYRVAWSPDGRTLASCGFDGTIQLWGVKQGSYRAALSGHTATIYSIAFTPDSSSLLSSSEDGTLRVWDVASGQCMRITQGYVPSLYDIAWDPTGKQLASGGSDRQVIIWDVSGGTPPRVLSGHNWNVVGVGWSPDGRWLASSSWDSVIRLWNPTSGACVHMLRDPEAYFQGIAWSPDGHLLACGTYMRGVHVWDVIARRRRWIGHMQLAKIRRVAWSPDGTRLVSCNDAGSVCVWEGSDGALLQQLSGHTGVVSSVAWSPDGTRLASGGGRGSGELFIWDARSGERVRTFEGHPGTVSAVAWGSSGEMLISGGSDGMLRWWNVQSGKCVKVRVAHQGAVQSLRTGPDGWRLASCGEDSAIMIWNQRSAEHLLTLRRDRPYERLNITGVRGLTEAQKITLRTLGAIEETESK